MLNRNLPANIKKHRRSILRMFLALADQGFNTENWLRQLTEVGTPNWGVSWILALDNVEEATKVHTALSAWRIAEAKQGKYVPLVGKYLLPNCITLF